MAAALIGTMCAGMAVPVMAADDEKVTLSVINYHVGTDVYKRQEEEHQLSGTSECVCSLYTE